MQWVFVARWRAKRPERRTRRARRDANTDFTIDDTRASRLWKNRMFLVMGGLSRFPDGWVGWETKNWQA